MAPSVIEDPGAFGRHIQTAFKELSDAEPLAEKPKKKPAKKKATASKGTSKPKKAPPMGTR
jgi:hypothetical protein